MVGVVCVGGDCVFLVFKWHYCKQSHLVLFDFVLSVNAPSFVEVISVTSPDIFISICYTHLKNMYKNYLVSGLGGNVFDSAAFPDICRRTFFKLQFV